MKEIVVGTNQCGQRLDKFLHKYLKEATNGFLYKMLRKKNIKLNGKRAQGKEMLQEGDVISIYLAQETLEKFLGQKESEPTVHMPKFELDIIYEDAHILILNKPAGCLSQKAKPEDISMVEYVRAYLANEDEGFSPGICNRLDRNTSGLLVAGKSLLGLQRMSELFRSRTLEKYYLAVVVGEMTQGGLVEGWLTKDKMTNQVKISEKPIPGASQIRTGYEPLCTDGELTVVRVRLYTGKTHQIRSHLASIGHPIAGDIKYGKKIPGLRARRQLLHGWELRFPVMDLPFEAISEARFVADPPWDFYADDKVKQLLHRMKL